MSSSLWVDKYRPTNIDNIIGNTNQIALIRKWLNVFKTRKAYKGFKNCILISGPPGIGKTSTVHILLKDYGYDVIEFNASELRTSKIISSKLETILSGKSIQMMFNKDIKTGIIMDEVDGIESRKEYSSNDMITYINYTENREVAKLKKLKKKPKKNDKIYINKNPIICICNSITRNLNSLLKYVVHIKFNGPSDSDIYTLLKKINLGENLGISDAVLNIITPYCQNDLRRTVYILEYISGFLKKNISQGELLKLVQNVGTKDMDIELYEAINKLYFDYSMNISEVLLNYQADQTFVPYIIHENFINFIDKNTHNSYEELLDCSINYYELLTDSQLFRNNMFGNWDFTEYVGVLSCFNSNFLIKNMKLKNTPKITSFEKSALISKYNYRFYNLKSINNICKKLDIDISNFHILSSFILYATFENQQLLPSQIKYLSSKNISLKEFEKILKLSPNYENYIALYTKKFQKNIISIFENN